MAKPAGAVSETDLRSNSSGNWKDSKPETKGPLVVVISKATSMVESISTPGKLATRIFSPVYLLAEEFQPASITFISPAAISWRWPDLDVTTPRVNRAVWQAGL